MQPLWDLLDKTGIRMGSDVVLPTSHPKDDFDSLDEEESPSAPKRRAKVAKESDEDEKPKARRKSA